MTAHQVKNEMLKYWRFQRKYNYIATEYMDRDVIVSNGISLVEIEVKVSYQDFLREWKKRKHRTSIPHTSNVHPHYYFFAVPDGYLGHQIATYLMEHKLPFGLFTVQDEQGLYRVRPAKRLHSNPIEQHVLKGIVQRMGSELLNLRIAREAER